VRRFATDGVHKLAREGFGVNLTLRVLDITSDKPPGFSDRDNIPLYTGKSHAAQ
jgi:hypothetical protein